MNKTISMSIRVSEVELEKLKQAAQIEAYGSYSEFIRRTALKEAERVIENKRRKNKNQEIWKVENCMAKKEPFDLKENKYYQKSLFDIGSVDCEKEFWNVDETI